ncbi:hypothetical protein Taro_033823 [Colocasia esculenta]|uniref:WAT1-related protein n=1 Tax=Colocasia esculenta TaxID=4460 RepID=A0A843VZ03_COLES|nr:hypothetical protein [Colocasia esculenta]
MEVGVLARDYKTSPPQGYSCKASYRSEGSRYRDITRRFMARIKCLEDYKPAMAMVGLQIIYAALSIMGKAVLNEGLSPRVLVVYRQGLGTLALAPVAYLSQSTTMNQNLYFLGLKYGSTSLATAMINLIPATTFLMAAPLGLEKVSLTSRGIAKIGGTFLSVGGAITMAVLKGPKLWGHVISNPSYNSTYNIVDQGANRDWFLSCLSLFLCCCCWSMWLIMQVPLSKTFSDPITLSTWMCFMGLLQSAIVTFFVEPDSSAWKLDGSFEMLYCVYAGVVGTGVSTYLQAWCVSKRGPLFSATFNPLCTVITTVLGVSILHEALYAGSLAGATAVVGGLYMVLWGKAVEVAHTKSCREQIKPDDHAPETDLEEPLLVDRQSG